MTDDPQPSPGDLASPRRPLSRQLIVGEAIAMIDEEGLAALTMRSLGGRLGVEAMALYRYVNGREDLLEGIVDALVGQIQVTPDGRLGPTEGWQGLLQWLAHAVRQIATEHPSIFPLVATRPSAAPWLRPPLRSLRVVDEFLAALVDRGFTDRQAVHTYRVFTSFLLGHLLLEASVRGASTGVMREPLDEGGAGVSAPGAGEVSDYPTLDRTAQMLADDHTHTEFEQALEALLDRLERELFR